MVAQRAADQQNVAGSNLLRPQRIPAGIAPIPAVLINSLSAAPRNDFGIAGDDGYLSGLRGTGHAVDHAFQRGHLNPSSRINPQER